jgi:hypothetical protein
VDDDAYDDPREALKFEAERAPELQKKKRESARWASLVRAERVAEGMDARIRQAMGAKPS